MFHNVASRHLCLFIIVYLYSVKCAISFDGGGIDVVLGDDVSLLGDTVLREERVELVVAAGLHFLELDFRPAIHGD